MGRSDESQRAQNGLLWTRLLSIRTELHDRRASNLTFFCTGAIPVELGMLVNLKKLWLGGNQLIGALSIRAENLSSVS